MRPLDRYLVWLFVVPQLLLLGLGGKLVVCFGSDGHVQIEVAAGDCCDEPGVGEQDGSRSADELDEGALEHCGPCTDVEIAMVRDVSPEFMGDAPSLPPVLPPTTMPEPVRPRSEARILLRPPSVAPQLAHLRVTVIRC